MKRFLWLGFVLFLYLICTGCGDTFRPIIIPNPPTFPNPAAAHSVVSINDNGTFVAGSVMVIDVSGDTDMSNANLDIHPVHAVQQTANQVLVVNQAVTQATVGNVPTTSCNVTIPIPPPSGPKETFNVCSSITRLSFSSTIIASTSSISLPIYSGANFVAAAPSDALAYVTLPTYPPDPTQPLVIVPSVSVVNTSSNLVAPPTPVGKNPVAIAVTPDKSKLYVANQGDGTISAFNTNAGNLSARTIDGSLTDPPIWLVARSDSQFVYVLEQTSGTLASIAITSTTGPDALTETTNPLIQVPGATTMTYDPNLNRLYIPGGQQMAIVDVSQSSPQYLAGGPIPTCDLAPKSTNCIPTVAPSSRGASDPCSLTSEQTLTVVAVAALPDHSRAYVGAYYEDTVDSVNYICPQVTVIDATSNTVEIPSIAIPGFPDATIPNLPGGLPDPYYAPICGTTNFRFTMAAGGDSTRAYLASCDGGNVNIIDTSNDAYIENLQAPLGSRPAIPPSLFNPPQNPVFFFAGP